MITKEELMLGDLVMYKDEVCKVTILSTNGSIGVTDRRDATTVVQGKELSPISITPEILKANGFVPIEIEGKSIFMDNSRLALAPNKEFSGPYNIYRTKIMIEYVHELQHALRLCKIEKEIKV